VRHVSQGDVASLLALFENAKTFGSLIQIPPKLAARPPEIEQHLNDVMKHSDLMHTSAHVIKPLLQQARLLARRYDAVVANPPYMGAGYFNPVLKEFMDATFSEASGDFYSAFIMHALPLSKANRTLSLITIPTWLFLPTSENSWIAATGATAQPCSCRARDRLCWPCSCRARDRLCWWCRH
jgi:Eco57I restriction-modification methylase